MSNDGNDKSPSLEQTSPPATDPDTERLKIRLQIITVVMTAITTVVTTVGGVALAYINARHAEEVKQSVDDNAVWTTKKVNEKIEKAANRVEDRVEEVGKSVGAMGPKDDSDGTQAGGVTAAASPSTSPPPQN